MIVFQRTLDCTIVPMAGRSMPGHQGPHVWLQQQQGADQRHHDLREEQSAQHQPGRFVERRIGQRPHDQGGQEDEEGQPVERAEGVARDHAAAGQELAQHHDQHDRHQRDEKRRHRGVSSRLSAE